MNYKEDGSPDFDEQVEHFKQKGWIHTIAFVFFAFASYYQYTNVQLGGSVMFLIVWFALMCYNGVVGARSFEIVAFWREEKARYQAIANLHKNNKEENNNEN